MEIDALETPLFKTRFRPVFGTAPYCANVSRLAEREQRRNEELMIYRQNVRNNRLMLTGNSDILENTDAGRRDLLYTSFNATDYLRTREIQSVDSRKVNIHSATKKLIYNDLLREDKIKYKVDTPAICSKWLTDSQIIFGTKCNKLLIYNVNTRRTDNIPLLTSRAEEPCDPGIFTITLNPSQTLLATGTKSNGDVGIYKLPDLSPLCIGEVNCYNTHLYSTAWINDLRLVSTAHYNFLAYYRLDDYISNDFNLHTVDDYYLTPSVLKSCPNLDRIMGLAVNNMHNEIMAVAIDSSIEVLDSITLQSKFYKKIERTRHSICVSAHPKGFYAIGCTNEVHIFDPRADYLLGLRLLDFENNSVNSLSFEDQLITIGTSTGNVLFFDLRAGNYFLNRFHNQAIFSSNPVDDVNNSVCTHAYSPGGSRLFIGGGRIYPIRRFYAAVWH